MPSRSNIPYIIIFVILLLIIIGLIIWLVYLHYNPNCPTAPSCATPIAFYIYGFAAGTSAPTITNSAGVLTLGTNTVTLSTSAGSASQQWNLVPVGNYYVLQNGKQYINAGATTTIGTGSSSVTAYTIALASTSSLASQFTLNGPVDGVGLYTLEATNGYLNYNNSTGTGQVLLYPDTSINVNDEWIIVPI